jgi:hypothetical protein
MGLYVPLLEFNQGGARSITTSEPGRTLGSGLVFSAQCTSKLDGKPAGPPVPQLSLWTVSRKRPPSVGRTGRRGLGVRGAVVAS